jgi:predicted nuclease of restriction endonuclease-like RecB superfamily
MEIKRYNLALPQTVFNELKDLSIKENTTVLGLIVNFIKLGLLLRKCKGDLFIRYREKETRIIII